MGKKITWPPAEYPNNGRKITQSIHTSGMIGGTQIFFNNGFDECVRRYRWGKKPPRPPPSGNGLWPSTLTTTWKAMSQEQRDTWNTRAKNAQLPPYTTYMQYNERRNVRGLPPVTEPP